MYMWTEITTKQKLYENESLSTYVLLGQKDPRLITKPEVLRKNTDTYIRNGCKLWEMNWGHYRQWTWQRLCVLTLRLPVSHSSRRYSQGSECADPCTAVPHSVGACPQTLHGTACNFGHRASGVPPVCCLTCFHHTALRWWYFIQVNRQEPVFIRFYSWEVFLWRTTQQFLFDR